MLLNNVRRRVVFRCAHAATRRLVAEEIVLAVDLLDSSRVGVASRPLGRCNLNTPLMTSAIYGSTDS